MFVHVIIKILKLLWGIICRSITSITEKRWYSVRCNLLFKFKANTICFENWIRIVFFLSEIYFYRKEIYMYIINILIEKHNILCGDTMLKQAMKKYIKSLTFQMHIMYIYQEKKFLIKIMYKDLFISWRTIFMILFLLIRNFKINCMNQSGKTFWILTPVISSGEIYTFLK